MANSTKQNLTTLGQIQSDTQEAYLSAPMVAAPSTTITDLSSNARQLRDPSKTLRPAMGIERVHTKSIKLVNNEKGPAGEQIWKLDNGDDRVRFVGNGWSILNGVNGSFAQSLNATDYVEITFYGTGLNLLAILAGGTYTYQYSLNGGTVTTFLSQAVPVAATGRNYASNIIVNVIPIQTLGTYTVKLTTTTPAVGLNISGFEILNESSSISIPKGEIVSNGKKEVIGTATTTAYNSGFDGSPVLNGRGGRVVKYIKNGLVGKVIQQTDDNQANLTSANHANEDIIRRINWREFGVNFSTDFTTVAGVSTSRSYTLDDGTTSLLSLVVVAQTTGSGADGLTPASLNAYISINFIGTGLDVIKEDFGATIDAHSITVDGVAIGNLVSTGASKPTLTKLVSGLPYGSHTVKIMRTVASALHIYFTDFIVYGPKKPSIPSNSTEIGEYYLMATYDASAVTGTAIIDNAQMPIGVLSKCPVRELLYFGTGWSVQPPGVVVSTLPHGLNVQSPTVFDSVSYPFFGTGINLHLTATSTSTYNFTVHIDGALNAAGTSLVSITNGGGGTYTSNTLNNGFPARLAFTGLTLGTHTVKITKTTGAGPMAIGAINVIAPIHYPNNKRGSLALKPVASFPKQTDVGSVDLSKAKAWITVDLATGSLTSSNNISATLFPATGQCIVFFEKPFKTNNYSAILTGEEPYGAASFSLSTMIRNKTAASIGLHVFDVTVPSIQNKIINAVFFGELADEDNE